MSEQTKQVHIHILKSFLILFMTINSLGNTPTQVGQYMDIQVLNSKAKAACCMKFIKRPKVCNYLQLITIKRFHILIPGLLSNNLIAGKLFSMEMTFLRISPKNGHNISLLCMMAIQLSPPVPFSLLNYYSCYEDAFVCAVPHPTILI